MVALDDFVGDAGDGTPQVVSIHHLSPGRKNAPMRGRCGSFSLGQANSYSVPASQDQN
jgi:hypothetical protein